MKKFSIYFIIGFILSFTLAFSYRLYVRYQNDPYTFEKHSLRKEMQNPNHPKTQEFYQKVCDLNLSGEACFELSKFYELHSTQELALLEKACEFNYGQACAKLGDYYIKKGKMEAVFKAGQYYIKACASNYTQACK